MSDMDANDALRRANEEIVTLKAHLHEARQIARDIFWGDIPPDRIEAVAVNVKRRLRLPPDAYIDWLED